MTITTAPETGRITLTLTAHTIKALRLLALLKGESQNDVAEALLIAGGLHNAVDSEWSAGKPEQPKPTAPAPVQVMSTPTPTPKPVTTAAPAPIPQAAPAPPKPASPRDGQMPDVPPPPTGSADDEIPW